MHLPLHSGHPHTQTGREVGSRLGGSIDGTESAGPSELSSDDEDRNSRSLNGDRGSIRSGGGGINFATQEDSTSGFGSTALSIRLIKYTWLFIVMVTDTLHLFAD